MPPILRSRGHDADSVAALAGEKKVIAAVRVERGVHPMVLRVVLATVLIAWWELSSLGWIQDLLINVVLVAVLTAAHLAGRPYRLIARTASGVVVLETQWLRVNQASGRVVRRLDPGAPMSIGGPKLSHFPLTIDGDRYWVWFNDIEKAKLVVRC